ncbi:hypothetical protein [Bacillus atrophaeus]|uniref:hypothetical protein n=1 Tax=Bacillus atrophaeus TaxID=1452 RepID=UPI0012FE062C|nr:hypothetical protein [Bacillus atrophaeus]
MNYITYFISQFMFISTLIAVSYFGGPYLRGPFTNVQIKAIILGCFYHRAYVQPDESVK